MPAKWAGWLVLVRWQLKRTMYDFKNSFSSDFANIHRAKYIFSREMFCLYHFSAIIRDVYDLLIRLSQTIVLSSQNKNFLLKTTFPDYLGQNHHRKSNFEKFYEFFDPAQAVQSFST